ncbi:tryptophan transporter [Erysipelothrix urinaevulpis]|uniref:tryptophan transporter n=1 Tax=Erysipelothrix urinaevulpis TaxID=2683717 RepID=UPI00135C5525|nr:tryptophan transporter [Erysipelothrix urinaevulpis]
MKTKTMSQSALLLGMGLILHMITPSFMGFMKPDFMLIMMLISLFKSTSFTDDFTISVIAGILSGLTSTMPFGLIANIVDKIIVGIIISHLKHLGTKKGLLTFIGTLISGLCFLLIIYFLTQLSIQTLKTLFFVHVIPTAFINTGIIKILQRNVLNAD